MKTEIWKDIPKHEGVYQVSSEGRVKSLDRVMINSLGKVSFLKGKMLKPGLAGIGYPFVSLRLNGKNWSRQIHRLMLLSFDPENVSEQVNHINGIKTDNRLENLEWCTAKENAKHAVTLGLTRSGERAYNTKITNEQALEIRSLFSKGVRQFEIAKMFGLRRGNVSDIVKRKTWTYI